MNIRGMSENKIITNNLIQLIVSGVNNYITIKSHVNTLKITGTNNKVNGLDPNCLINNINITGISNDINLNQNCSNVNKTVSGLHNSIKIGGIPDNGGNNMNNNIRNNNNNNVRIIRIGNGNIQTNFSSNQSLNSMMNDLNNLGIHINLNNQNQNRNNANNNNNNNINVNNDDDDEENEQNLSDFDRKKQNLFLEMDEYQYKHIQRYESRKETECAICLEEFKGIDIIKAFYKCEHIFHKKCLKSWLKRSNLCPLCKHDLTEDINQMQ